MPTSPTATGTSSWWPSSTTPTVGGPTATTPNISGSSPTASVPSWPNGPRCNHWAMAAPADGRYSVAFPKRWWYPACPSGDVTRRPIPITLMDTPLVLFRDGDGRAHALLDRCPHRNAPLSLGRVESDGSLACGYHGWRFNGQGDCVAIPGLAGLAGVPTAPSSPRNAIGHATVERDGFVWVWGEPAAAGVPTREPFALPPFTGPGTGEAVFSCALDCTLHAALENSRDVPHTAFLHGGIFRGGSAPTEITAVRRELPDGLEVQFIGEPVGFGPVRRRR